MKTTRRTIGSIPSRRPSPAQTPPMTAPLAVAAQRRLRGLVAGGAHVRHVLRPSLSVACRRARPRAGSRPTAPSMRRPEVAEAQVDRVDLVEQQQRRRARSRRARRPARRGRSRASSRRLHASRVARPASGSGGDRCGRPKLSSNGSVEPGRRAPSGELDRVVDDLELADADVAVDHQPLGAGVLARALAPVDVEAARCRGRAHGRSRRRRARRRPRRRPRARARGRCRCPCRARAACGRPAGRPRAGRRAARRCRARSRRAARRGCVGR